MLESRNIYGEGARKVLADLHTALPGRIVSYDDSTMTATVELGIQRQYQDKEPQTYPLIDDVPVILPAFKTCQIRPPASELNGCTCLVVFTERSIDEWLNGDGEPVPPFETRRFSISDAVAIPGLAPDALRPERQTPSSAFEFSRGTSYFSIKESGGLMLAKANRELFSLLQTLCQILKNTKTNTGIGLQPFDPGTLQKIEELQKDFQEMSK